MTKGFAAMALAMASTAALAADYKVDINAIDTKGEGKPLGTVMVTEAPGGVTFTPNLKGLPPGEHGFHVHEFANCGAKEKDGKLTAGAMAGEHWDPAKTGKHGGEGHSGHRGDLPPLVVAADGSAKAAVTVNGLKLSELGGKALMIHAGGDNRSDQPLPNGGGGERVACGIIQRGEK